LIAPGWAITAAHCTEGLSGPGDISVLVNWDDLSEQTNRPGEVHRVAEIIDHPSYDGRELTYDFSLLRLATVTTHKPIELDNGGFSFAGAEQTVAGWGSMDPDRVRTHWLEGNVPRD
jgi:secreted trypsin-like serine protease